MRPAGSEEATPIFSTSNVTSEPESTRTLAVNLSDDPVGVIDCAYGEYRGERLLDIMAGNERGMYVQLPTGSHLPSFDMGPVGSWVFRVLIRSGYAGTSSCGTSCEKPADCGGGATTGGGASGASSFQFFTFVLGLALEFVFWFLTLGGVLLVWERKNGRLLLRNWAESVVVEYLERVWWAIRGESKHSESKHCCYVFIAWACSMGRPVVFAF